MISKYGNSLLAAAAASLLALAGCATTNALDSDVSSYSQWPAERKASTYAFERLPSQEANPQQQDELEAAAREALMQAGFTESSDPKASDVTVQLGMRLTRQDAYPWGDPFGYYGGFNAYGSFGYYGRGRRGWGGGGFWGGPGFGSPYYDTPRYLREVAVLIRDRQTGKPLYETHASSDGYVDGGMSYMTAMFDAALKDFPQPALNPRRVTVPLAVQ